MVEDVDVVLDLKQSLYWFDYFGVFAVWFIFFTVVFAISFFCLNWFCVQKTDDVTVFEKWAAPHKVKMGPHRLSVVDRKMEEEKRMVARLA